MRFARLFLVLTLLLPCFAAPARAGQYLQAAGVVDTRTVFSDGAYTVEKLVRLARSRGVDAVFFNDHDRLVMEYGIFPFEHLLRKRESLNSIHQNGVEAYLAAIGRARDKFPAMILIPGTESVPYYYWTGSYFSGNLTAHDHEKRLLAVGLERAKDYQRMPILHNGFSTRYAPRFIPRVLMFSGALVIGIFLTLDRRRGSRAAGIAVCVVSALLLVNTMPFRSSPYDQYMGEQGIAPYQRYIDYVTSTGAMVFWNYPETRSGIRRMGPIELYTPPYPEVLEQSRDYTGFAAVYGDTITVTEPGREWDRVLTQYCNGERLQPVWGISTADYHQESGAGGMLGNFLTVFLVRGKTQNEVLEAMRAGRMYALRGRHPQRMILDEFTISDPESGKAATLGQEIAVVKAPKIRIALSAAVSTDRPVTIRLIRNGDVIRTFEEKLPFATELVEDGISGAGKSFYRLDARGPAGILVANPIFVDHP